MDITGFEKIAPHLANPLVLAGFGLMLTFGIHKAIISSKLLYRLNPEDSATIIKLILLTGLLFMLAVLGLVAWNSYMEKEKTHVAALSAFEAAYSKMLKSRNKDLQAMALGNLGIVHWTLGELNKAEKMHKEALELDKASNNKEGMAQDYGNLGIVYKTRGELDKAEKMYKESLALHEGLGSKEGMAADYANLGSVYKQRGNLAQAEAAWKKSLRLYQEMNMPDAKDVQQWLDDLAQQKIKTVQ
jgi:tetratricopeptide (TPR) repeat protein